MQDFEAGKFDKNEDETMIECELSACSGDNCEIISESSQSESEDDLNSGSSSDGSLSGIITDDEN